MYRTQHKILSSQYSITWAQIQELFNRFSKQGGLKNSDDTSLQHFAKITDAELKKK